MVSSALNAKREIVAVAGKGGTGKTTFVAIVAKLLAQAGQRLLAVDADPPISLTYALGAAPERTVGDLRYKLIEDPRERRRIGDKHLREVLADEVLVRVHGIDLLILGQAEGPGCFCSINELLKYGIGSLSRQYEVVVIDCEAGIEQINRRVIDCITTLLMISDATIKGLRTAAYLRDIAGRYGVQGQYRTGLVINRACEGVGGLQDKARDMGLDLLGLIPEDANVSRYDRIGQPTIDLPDDSPSVLAVRCILEDLGLVP
jgi:CO dehydrogenase maturation factor